MADTQIRGLGTGSAPLSYTVPGSQEIVLKSLFAAFDGSGAATAFYPCIRIVAPGGGVVGEYITDATVAAGSSAEVSFAPFLRNTPTSTPSTGGGLPSAAMIKTNTQTVAGNAIAQISLDATTFATTDPAIFTASGSNIVIHATGKYAAYIHFVDDNAATDPTATEFYPKWLGATLGANAPWQQIVPRMFNVNGPAGLQGGDPVGLGLVDSIANTSIAYVSELNGTVGAWLATLTAATIKTSTCLLSVEQLQPISAATLAGFPSYPL